MSKRQILEYLLESNTSISVTQVCLSLAMAVVLGMLLYFVYRKTYRGTVYSKDFNLTLLLVAIITTLVMQAIGSNLALSLGMVGSLSIIRFRTAVKEPRDIAFLFWAIAVGIVLAAGLIPLAVLGSVFVGIVLLVFAKKKTVDAPYILVLHCADSQAEEQARIFVSTQVRRMNLKSKSVERGVVELNYEVRLREDSSAFVNELEAMDGVSRVVLVSYNGDYMG